MMLSGDTEDKVCPSSMLVHYCLQEFRLQSETSWHSISPPVWTNLISPPSIFTMKSQLLPVCVISLRDEVQSSLDTQATDIHLSVSGKDTWRSQVAVPFGYSLIPDIEVHICQHDNVQPWCICVYVRMYVCTYLYKHICMCVHGHMCVYVYPMVMFSKPKGCFSVCIYFPWRVCVFWKEGEKEKRIMTNWKAEVYGRWYCGADTGIKILLKLSFVLCLSNFHAFYNTHRREFAHTEISTWSYPWSLIIYGFLYLEFDSH